MTDCARARNWQSHRVTRRSLILLTALEAFETVFHPVPSHNGQTSAGALITEIASCRMDSDLTLHPEDRFAQAGIGGPLCTSCEGGRAPVEGGGNPGREIRKAAPLGQTRAGYVRNRLPARIFTVDIRRRGRRIRSDQVSQLSARQFPPGLRWA